MLTQRTQYQVKVFLLLRQRVGYNCKCDWKLEVRKEEKGKKRGDVAQDQLHQVMREVSESRSGP